MTTKRNVTSYGKPFDDGDPRVKRVGPGTESNRARAARGGPGPDVLSVYLDRQRIAGAPMDRVDVGAQCGCGAYPGQDHWSDCAKLERPSSVAWSGVVPAPVVSLPSTLAEAERLYGKGSPVWEAVLWQAKHGAMEIKPAAPAQPDPASGQVWAPAAERWVEYLDADGTITIGSVDRGYAHPIRSDGKRLDFDGIQVQILAQGWTCIGVATPHGRVMVGDGWQRDGGSPFEVTVIASEDGEPWIKVRYAGAQQDHDFDARNLWDCAGYHRTRYAPARAGERYRWRPTGEVMTADADAKGALRARDGSARPPEPIRGLCGVSGDVPRLDPAQWERLDAGAPADDGSFRLTPEQIDGVVAGHMGVLREHQRIANQALASCSPLTATGEDLDRHARLYGIDRRPAQATAYRGGTDRETDESLRARCVERLGLPGALDARPRPDHYTLPPLDGQRTLTLAPGSRLTPIGDGRTFRIEPEAAERDTLTLQGPARDLRALADAVGRALEGAEPVAITFNSAAIIVARDEMLFTPTHVTGFAPTAADQPLVPFGALAGDTRALCALRRCLLDAMASADGRATLAQWGAKGPTLVVRREGPLMVAPAAEQASTAPRYDGANGGADQWRWEVGE